MKIIGRMKEQDTLEQCVRSGRPEFVAVYGRRRVGKTFLIKEYFKNCFSFYVTGVPESKNNRQRLSVFHMSLKEYGCREHKAPSSWLEAFSRLKMILSAGSVRRDPATNRRIVFFDELPWLDSPKSDFRMALDWFWNSWASSQPDLCLIVCGSATSWIIKHLLSDTGGLYNRITRRIHLRPFSLLECEEFFQNNGIELPRAQIIDAYMVWGGIPYYLNDYDRRLSFEQNVQKMFFDETGSLFREHEKLFHALFKHAENHWKVVETLACHKMGMSRTDISKKTGIDNGLSMTRVLQELEECGFIRKFQNYAKKTRESIYQLIDPYTLFYLTFIRGQNVRQWTVFARTPAYYAWSGNAFEIVCIHHIPQIKQALGISGIQTMEYAWFFRGNDAYKGAQIDLLIDRADSVITICEMKHTEGEYTVTKETLESLIHKRESFRRETKTKKALMLAMVSAQGITKSGYWSSLQNIITGEDLFLP